MKLKYERIKYPDNQISAHVTGYSSDITIRERINSYEDLFYIKSIVDVLRHTDPQQKVSLFIPCMFGQRSDRRFIGSQSFDLKIICDFINTCNFNSVEILDPHSDVSMALLNNSIKNSSKMYVRQAIEDTMSKIPDPKNFILVSPDAGAYKKVFDYALAFKVAVTAAVKHRDLDGTIALNFIGDVKGKDCLIVDDLCDGGYTFYLLAKALREQGAKSVRLYVSHGYFSKGFNTLLDDKNQDSPLIRCLDHIYCTNSVKDIVPTTSQEKEFITQFKVI